jgi:hypothetical protein
MQESYYVANPAFDATVAWKTQRFGDILVNKNAIAEGKVSTEFVREDAVLVVVGTVEPERLYVTPTGNFNPQFDMDFQKSKFQLSLRRPSDPDFGPDFDAAVEKLKKLQTAIGRTNSHRYLVLHQGGDIIIRLSAPMFELRVRRVAPASNELGCLTP